MVKVCRATCELLLVVPKPIFAAFPEEGLQLCEACSKHSAIGATSSPMCRELEPFVETAASRSLHMLRTEAHALLTGSGNYSARGWLSVRHARH